MQIPFLHNLETTSYFSSFLKKSIVKESRTKKNFHGTSWSFEALDDWNWRSKQTLLITKEKLFFHRPILSIALALIRCSQLPHVHVPPEFSGFVTISRIKEGSTPVWQVIVINQCTCVKQLQKQYPGQYPGRSTRKRKTVGPVMLYYGESTLRPRVRVVYYEFRQWRCSIWRFLTDLLHKWSLEQFW